MSQTLTISAPLAMSAVPALMLTGGIIVGWFLRADLSTSIEAARLVARNDEQAARWLWKRGYRSTPHAGPDITPELPADDAVTGELLAVDGVDTESDAPHEDTDRAGMWRVLLGLARDVNDRAWRAVARGVGYGIEWAAYLLKSEQQREAEFTETYHRALEQARDAEYAGRRRCEEEAPVNPSYKSRHVHPDFATGVFPVINPSIPAQRSGDADADR